MPVRSASPQPLPRRQPAKPAILHDHPQAAVRQRQPQRDVQPTPPQERATQQVPGKPPYKVAAGPDERKGQTVADDRQGFGGLGQDEGRERRQPAQPYLDVDELEEETGGVYLSPIPEGVQPGAIS